MAATGNEKLYVSQGGGGKSTVSVQEIADFSAGEAGTVNSVNGVSPIDGDVTLSPVDLGGTSVGVGVFLAADAATARTAIGAGTSSLVLGTTAGTALAGNGNAATASAWLTGRTITLTGGTTGVSGAFTGAANLSFATTLATPTGAVRGGVLQGAAVADITPAADGTTAGTALNALLAQLRIAGIIAP